MATWLTDSADSPLARIPEGADIDAWFDVKVIYQQAAVNVDLSRVPAAFLARTGPFQLVDYEKVYAADPAQDIFALREIDRSGVLVVVRPDQYVAHILPLAGTAELAAFFEPILWGNTLAEA